MTYEDRLRVCGLTTLEELRVRGDQIECFKILNGYTDYGNDNFFSLAKDRHDVNTRSAVGELLVPQRATLEIRRNFFSSRVVNIWNSLPYDIRAATSVNSFKNQYDLFYNTTTED